ncbi:PIG-L deacetylase family protein [Plastoroseomonas arctica]|nr:PIG-L family deacetylase [Plastoroseomonas arctica]
MPHALALSPHLDDAAFSCGGTLARLVQQGWSVTVCTVFTRSVTAPSGFALACQTDKGLAPDVDYMALRRAEDAAACAVLGAEPLWLNWPEAPHRGYQDAAALFGRPLEEDPAHGLAETLPDGPADLLLAPQAVGGHVDHVLLVQALRLQARPVLWWTDFPYATRAASVRPFDADMKRLAECQVEGDAQARLHACAAYTTQLPFQFGGMKGLEAALNAEGDVESFRGDAARLPRGIVR